MLTLWTELPALYSSEQGFESGPAQGGQLVLHVPHGTEQRGCRWKHLCM